MAFRKDNIGKCFKIDDIRDYIPKDHPCYVVEEIVGRMDFSKWEEAHWDTRGNPAYHPRIILRPIILGYIDGLDSGRAIANHIRTDITYMYLCGFDTPDFRTINRFYKNHPEFIAEALLELIKYAKEMDLVRLNKLVLNKANIKVSAFLCNIINKNHIELILNSVYEIIKNNEKEDKILVKIMMVIL